MKISPDQNTITLDDGTVLVAVDSSFGCRECHFNFNGSICQQCTHDIPCSDYDRNDGKDKIFIKEPK